MFASERQVVFANLLFKLFLQDARGFRVGFGRCLDWQQINRPLAHLPQRERDQRNRERHAKRQQSRIEPNIARRRVSVNLRCGEQI